MKILVTTKLTAEKRKLFEEFEDIELIEKELKDVTEEDLSDVEVILGNVFPALCNSSKTLKWIQLDSAGAAQYKDLREDIIVTNCSGAYGEAIAEHMLGCVLLVMKNLARYMELQKTHDWVNLGSVHTISSSKVFCMGMGDIGSTFAEKMKVLGAEVDGISRSGNPKKDVYDHCYSIDQLDSILPGYDVVAMSLPGTAETEHIMDEKRLRAMKEGSILINVGRGSAIDSLALQKVMEEKHLARCVP